MPGDDDALSVVSRSRHACTVLQPCGVLDGTNYRALRDEIIKAALEEPRAVIVDVTDLSVPAESAWAVFTSARWHVDRWPEVPIVLVCEHPVGRSAIARNGVTRYVPVYPNIGAATDALDISGPPPLRRRVRTALPAQGSSVSRAREWVSEWLTAWSHTELIPVAKVVVTSLVENVLKHTDSAPCVRLEFHRSAVTVAVEDDCRAPAIVREDGGSVSPPSGLRIVAALCRTWGNAPTPSGKTVWAVVGPENRL